MSCSGVVRLTYRDRKRLKQDARSPCRHRIPPFARRLGSEDPQRRSRDEMALKVEGVVDRGMHAEEALGRARRFEALHFALSSPHRLMRIFDPIVFFEDPAHEGRSAATPGTPSRRSAACQLPAISARTFAF